MAHDRVERDDLAPALIKQFQSVTDSDDTACGRALRTRQICQISDVDVDPAYVDYRAAAAEAGYRAAQSTPLFGVKGEILGILSVHFKEPHTLSSGTSS